MYERQGVRLLFMGITSNTICKVSKNRYALVAVLPSLGFRLIYYFSICGSAWSVDAVSQGR